MPLVTTASSGNLNVFVKPKEKMDFQGDGL